MTSVESRRVDLDEVMQAFARAIEDSFERVEGRAREMGVFLTEASARNERNGRTAVERNSRRDGQ